MVIGGEWADLKPEDWLTEEVLDDRADRLNELMPNVFNIVSRADGRREAVVNDARNCGMSKNYMMEPDLAKAVHVDRVPNHYIFSVESTGQIPAPSIYLMALDILSAKCDAVLESLAASNGRLPAAE